MVSFQKKVLLEEGQYLQIGFKRKHSISRCTFIVNKTIQYYKNKHNKEHIILLDASQAFDRVNYQVIWKVIRQRIMSNSNTRSDKY